MICWGYLDIYIQQILRSRDRASERERAGQKGNKMFKFKEGKTVYIE